MKTQISNPRFLAVLLLLLGPAAQAALPTLTGITVMVNTNGTVIAPTNFWAANWTNVAGAAPGVARQVIFNDEGDLGADPGFEYVKESDTLWVPNLNVSLTNRVNTLIVTNATIFKDATPEAPAVGFQFFAKDVAGVSEPWTQDKAGTERKVLLDHSGEYAHDFYIGKRTDGLPGNGSLTDPFDGSTAEKFGVLMTNLVGADNVHDVTVRILPGTYIQTGDESWSVGSNAVNVSVLGAGTDCTFLVLSNLTSFSPRAINVYPGGNGVTISGFDLEVGTLTATEPISTRGVRFVGGTNLTCSNVRVRGSKANYTAGFAEAFAIMVAPNPDNSKADKVVIRDNIVIGATVQAGDFMSAIASEADNSLIEKNWIEGVQDAGIAGLNIGGNNVKVLHNSVTNAMYAVYRDYWSLTNQTISDNVLHGQLAVWYVNPSSADCVYNGINFVNNQCFCTNRSIQLNSAFGQANLKHVIISGNTFPLAGTGVAPIQISVYDGTDVAILNNTFVAGALLHQNSDAVHVWASGNRHFDGTIVAAYNSSGPLNSEVTGSLHATEIVTSSLDADIINATATTNWLCAVNAPLEGLYFSGDLRFQEHGTNRFQIFTGLNGTPQESGTMRFRPYAAGGDDPLDTALYIYTNGVVYVPGLFIAGEFNTEVFRFSHGIVTNTMTASNMVARFMQVDDDAYAAGWDASTNVPTKNAVYDKMETKANIASPTFTGDPVAPTPSASDNDTSLATTAFVTGSTVTFTGKTFDAKATGNVLKQTEHLVLMRPDYGDGAGAVPQTNTYTVSGLMHYTFADAETNVNWVVYETEVPKGIDTAVTMTATIGFMGGGTDADTVTFHLTYALGVAGTARPSNKATITTSPIVVTTTPVTPASGDVQISASTPLTGWNGAMTPGTPLFICMARLNDSNDDPQSEMFLDIAYGSTK